MIQGLFESLLEWTFDALIHVFLLKLENIQFTIHYGWVRLMSEPVKVSSLSYSSPSMLTDCVCRCITNSSPSPLKDCDSPPPHLPTQGKSRKDKLVTPEDVGVLTERC